jgi:teichuronic acid biosynthesis glycosyltransferase TuaC
MRILVVVSNYPHPGHRFSGIFNERSVNALKENCELVAVLAPRPYVPNVLTNFLPPGRWEAYAEVKSFEVRNGIAVYRPPYLQLPRVAASFWQDRGAYFCCVKTVRKLMARHKFDAILSFGLDGSGGLAWRLARRFGILVAVWATGSDIRNAESTAAHQSVLRTLRNADLVIYQSRELLEIAARITNTSPQSFSSKHHIVLSRGIPEPPILPKDELRRRERAQLGIGSDEILVLFIGRVTRPKGMFELLEAMSLAVSRNRKLKCLIIGSKPAFDETATIQKKLEEALDLREHVKMLAACDPEKVWEYLCAADIFAFPSHNEGMPNSLLEAMAMGVPSIAFAIPAILELESGTGAVALVPPLNTVLFGQAILRLAASQDERARIGKIGKEQVMERFMVRKNMGKACAHLARIIAERVQANERISGKTVLANFDGNP